MIPYPKTLNPRIMNPKPEGRSRGPANLRGDHLSDTTCLTQIMMIIIMMIIIMIAIILQIIIIIMIIIHNTNMLMNLFD